MKALLIIILISVTSCKTNKSNSSASENSEQTNNTSEAKPAENWKKKEALSVDYKPEDDKKDIQSSDSIYSLVVSFYSKGEGIDYKSQEEYASFLKKKPKVVYEELRWGREGEIDYCINLNELSTQEKEEFISETRALLVKSNLVHIKENEQCVHKR